MQEPAADANAVWHANSENVDHYAVPFDTTRRGRLTKENEMELLERALVFIDEFQPDVVLSYGAGVFEQRLRQTLQERSIPTVFYLANPNYKKMGSFQYADKIFTDTQATGDLYRERGLESFTIGKFVNRPNVSSDETRQNYVTFVNPSPEKGVTLFYRILQLAQEVVPRAKFLVVESRGSLDIAEARAGIPFSSYKSVTRLGLQKDMSEVFSMTKVLLMPSVWHESGARTAIEACSVGVPTIATDHGGVPEILGDGGILIAPPPPLLENHWIIPPLTAAIPWVEAIDALLNDKETYRLHSEAALERWSHHEPSVRVGVVLDQLQELIQAVKDK